MATIQPWDPTDPLSAFRGFVDTLNLEGFTGVVEEVSPAESTPVLPASPPLALPAGAIAPVDHDCKKFPRMMLNASRTDRPEKVELAKQYFKACPNCRRRAWEVFTNLDEVLSIKDEEQPHSQD